MYFELKPGMVWPDGSWVLSRMLGDEAARNLVSILLILAAIGLVVGGIGILVRQHLPQSHPPHDRWHEVCRGLPNIR